MVFYINAPITFIINPPRKSTGRSLGFSSGGSKEIGQILDNGSKNSENQNKDGVRPKIAQKYQIVSLL